MNDIQEPKLKNVVQEGVTAYVLNAVDCTNCQAPSARALKFNWNELKRQ